MAIPRSSPVPVPVDVLQSARTYLAPEYGSEVWEDDTHRVLMIRVPRDEPDTVNDLEEAIEYLSPGDAQGLTHLLLMGDKRLEAVYPQPVRDLMAARVDMDKKECARLRDELPHHGHRFYKSPNDPRRLVRLGLRLPHASVHGFGDTDIERFLDTVGPELAAGVHGTVRAVYLVADRDDVRLDPDVILPDLKARWEDEGRRREAIERAEREREDARRERERDRAGLLGEMRRRFGETERFQETQRRTARAPLRSTRGGTWEAPEGLDDVLARAPDTRAEPPAPRPPTRATREAAAESTGSLPPLWAKAKKRLESVGFQVIARPAIPGHDIHLAAEDPTGSPARVIVVFPDRLDEATAKSLLATARAVQADVAIAVAEQADPNAKQAFVGTKGRWVQPHQLDGAWI